MDPAKTLEEGRKLVEEMHRKAAEALPPDFMDRFKREPATIHWSELPPATPGAGAEEWETYRREVGRLLAEGREGQWALIKNSEIVGFWTAEEEAIVEGCRRFYPQVFLVHQIQERERLLKISRRLCA